MENKEEVSIGMDKCQVKKYLTKCKIVLIARHKNK